MSEASPTVPPLPPRIDSNKGQYSASRKHFERALRVMPGGNSRTQLYTSPHPLYALRGQGARITLADGRELDDFLLNYTAAAVGYAHPTVLSAVRRTVEMGGAFGMPTTLEVDFAETLCARIPAVERVRFTNSGSEATLHAIRAARAYTGRSLIVKAEGAYHGSHDLTDYSVRHFATARVSAVPDTRGMPEGLARSVHVVPFNDLEATLFMLDERRDDIAAVIMEPFLNASGVIPATREYLQGIARWCQKHGILLILDEIASFRTSYSGAHSDYGVTPDLICLGKAIGGGYAIGAFGGRHDVMSVFDPRDPLHVKHAGTFNAHPVTLAAGLATLEILDKETIERMNRLSKRISDGVRQIGARSGLPLTATVYGSIGCLHAAPRQPSNARDAFQLRTMMLDLYWELIEAGYIIAPRGQFSTCAVTSQEQVDGFLAALNRCAPFILGR